MAYITRLNEGLNMMDETGFAAISCELDGGVALAAPIGGGITALLADDCDLGASAGLDGGLGLGIADEPDFIETSLLAKRRSAEDDDDLEDEEEDEDDADDEEDDDDDYEDLDDEFEDDAVEDDDEMFYDEDEE